MFACATLMATADERDEAEMELVRQIHAHITGTRDKASGRYTTMIGESAVTFTMLPIPAGTFRMGTPEDEPGRRSDEGPQHAVKISAFWMAEHPVTWDAFELFMYPRNGDEIPEALDGISRPTPPYVDMTFGMGRSGYPAISMTHQAASKFCQWLSARTGHFYRLPTEAEWEYAARAGTSTAYFFGDDPQKLDQYAWHAGNSDYKTQPVGQKKANPWGLHDMHGNVWEWTLDKYSADGYTVDGQGKPNVNPWRQPAREYPRAVRGGSWNDAPEDLRSGARKASSSDWKMLDPQLPQSIWYHTSAPWVGFRIVRPQEVPTPEEMYDYWNR